MKANKLTTSSKQLKIIQWCPAVKLTTNETLLVIFFKASGSPVPSKLCARANVMQKQGIQVKLQIIVKGFRLWSILAHGSLPATFLDSPSGYVSLFISIMADTSIKSWTEVQTSSWRLEEKAGQAAVKILFNARQNPISLDDPWILLPVLHFLHLWKAVGKSAMLKKSVTMLT